MADYKFGDDFKDNQLTDQLAGFVAAKKAHDELRENPAGGAEKPKGSLKDLMDSLHDHPEEWEGVKEAAIYQGYIDVDEDGKYTIKKQGGETLVKHIESAKERQTNPRLDELLKVLETTKPSDFAGPIKEAIELGIIERGEDGRLMAISPKWGNEFLKIYKRQLHFYAGTSKRKPKVQNETIDNFLDDIADKAVPSGEQKSSEKKLSVIGELMIQLDKLDHHINDLKEKQAEQVLVGDEDALKLLHQELFLSEKRRGIVLEKIKKLEAAKTRVDATTAEEKGDDSEPRPSEKDKAEKQPEAPERDEAETRQKSEKKEAEKEPEEIAKLKVELNKIDNRIRTVKDRLRSNLEENGSEKELSRELFQREAEREKIINQIEEAEEAKRKAEEVRELQHAAETAEAVYKGSELGKNLDTLIEAKRTVPRPPEMSFISRLYLGLRERNILQVQIEREKSYKEAQTELKKLEAFKESWLKDEVELARMMRANGAAGLEFIKQNHGKRATKEDLGKLLQESADALRLRDRINQKLEKEKAKYGLTGYGPVSANNWEKISFSSEAFEKVRATTKEELLDSFGRDPVNEKVAGLYHQLEKERQKGFVEQQSGLVLQSLADARARERGLELILREIYGGRKPGNEQEIFELVDLYERTKQEVASLEEKTAVILKGYLGAQKAEERGKAIKESLKKQFGEVLQATDPEFEINFDTNVADIILNGQNKLAKGLSLTREMGLVVPQSVNASKRAINNFRLSINRGLSELIPESDRLAAKVAKLEENAVKHELKKEEIERAISYIVSTKASAWERVLAQAEVKEALKEKATAELIEVLAINDKEKKVLKALYKEDGLSEKFIRRIVKDGELKKYRNTKESRQIKKEINEVEAEIEMLDHLAAKKGKRLYRERALDLLADLMDKRAELLNEKARYDSMAAAITEDMLRDVEKLRGVAEKKLIEGITKTLKKAA